jgi:hypothetical protein
VTNSYHRHSSAKLGARNGWFSGSSPTVQPINGEPSYRLIRQSKSRIPL